MGGILTTTHNQDSCGQFAPSASSRRQQEAAAAQAARWTHHQKWAGLPSPPRHRRINIWRPPGTGVCDWLRVALPASRPLPAPLASSRAVSEQCSGAMQRVYAMRRTNVISLLFSHNSACNIKKAWEPGLKDLELRWDRNELDEVRGQVFVGELDFESRRQKTESCSKRLFSVKGTFSKVEIFTSVQRTHFFNREAKFAIKTDWLPEFVITTIIFL